MKLKTDGLKLLPNLFYKLGFGVLILSILFFIVGSITTLGINKEGVKNITTISLLISFLLIGGSKSKRENDSTMIVRMRSLSVLFLVVIVDSIISIFIDGELFLTYNRPSFSIGIIFFLFIYFLVMMWKGVKD
ncbi:MAG: hypothetical protein CR982_05160 [Candidatus Cloacimonadota bacterium]|nr:MAG: hypothetical protein CR982_05160 [Candidatus Cloacimonadota bacterium]PIE78808.1 MAG: hypothetical protein CSA15_06045 [Candidatus Delongbacteria bacterium]